MLSSIFGNHDTHAVKRHRSRPSSHASKSTHRPKKAAPDDDEVKQSAADKPGVEELREKRRSYYSLSPAQRRQLAARTSTTASKARSSRPSATARSSASKHGVRRRRKPAASRNLNSKSSTSTVGRARVEDFVYGPTPPPVAQDHEEPVGVGKGSQQEKTAGQARTKASIVSSKTASKRRSLPTVVETEVTPDDSISQVAERREDRAAARQSSGRSQGRPSVKRSSTTSSRLQSVAETSEEHHRSSTTSKRSSKRPSTLLPPAQPRRHSTTDVPSSTKLVECLTCGSDDIPQPKSAELSCGHRMCHDCLKRVFEMSVKDPVHMPPKCCTDEHIPLKHVDKLFDLKFKVLWNRKYQEYHSKNRVYCPTPKCGEWIKPKHFHKNSEGRNYALCPRCKTNVCTLCNNKMHKSSDCPKDPEIAKLVEQAKEKGWQRCYDCNAMVELQSGCNHMTCRCTAEFCMLCGAKWKTCNCPWFNYSQIPNPDRLNDMRVPEPIRVIYRRVLDAAGGIPPPAAAPPEVTYQQELDDRRRQERTDADLARRLQLASLWEDDDRPARRRPPAADGTWGIGNAAGHHLNEDFVQNAADVVMGAFGDAAGFGRRGERSAGRRRRARQEEGGGDDGLAPGWLGDASVLGVGPATRPR